MLVVSSSTILLNPVGMLRLESRYILYHPYGILFLYHSISTNMSSLTGLVGKKKKGTPTSEFTMPSLNTAATTNLFPVL